MKCLIFCWWKSTLISSFLNCHLSLAGSLVRKLYVLILMTFLREPGDGCRHLLLGSLLVIIVKLTASNIVFLCGVIQRYNYVLYISFVSLQRSNWLFGHYRTFTSLLGKDDTRSRICSIVWLQIARDSEYIIQCSVTWWWFDSCFVALPWGQIPITNLQWVLPLSSKPMKGFF